MIDNKVAKSMTVEKNINILGLTLDLESDIILSGLHISFVKKEILVDINLEVKIYIC